MGKKLSLIAVILGMLATLLVHLGINNNFTDKYLPREEVTYLAGSDMLYDMMETSTTYLVTQHKALGGSHYAYTEGLYEESTGEAASNVGTESNFRPGSRLVLLQFEAEGDKVRKTEKVILLSDEGCIRDVDVSADGTKCIFSWKKNNSDDFHIYEMELTSGIYSCRQLTFGSGVADFECVYLPNGEILFSSSRAVQTVDCWKTPVSNLYKMSSDGENIVRLGYDQVHTTYPTVTEDGRVIYTRWDYNDRTQMWVQGMFQMNPDGTNQTELYGNNSNFPTTLTHTRSIPGNATTYVSIATGHHTYQAGKLCLIDVSEKRDGADSISFPFGKETKDDNIDGYGQEGALYQYPYPLSENQILVSYCKKGWSYQRENTPFGLYLMDMSNGDKIELITGSGTYPSAQAVPVKTREVFVRPSMVDYAKTTGTYYVADVYQGEAMQGIERGTVKQIRVVALDYRAYAVGATVSSGSGSADPYTPIATGRGSWDVKTVLGVATVYDDGSAMFSVPSETPVYFQLLDKDGNMIQTMRSWSTLMPNESYSCVGCHEDNNTAPPASGTVTMALKAGVETLKGDVWQNEEDFDPYTTDVGFDYLEEVQPIFDNNCISCHNNKNESYEKINARAMGESGVTITVSGIETEIFPTQSEWNYRIKKNNTPMSGWNKNTFLGIWSKGKAGFGNRNGDGGAVVNTDWSGEKPWLFLRKEFTIKDLSALEGSSLRLNIFYDDTPTIYLNGNVIFTDDGWIDGYTAIDLDKKYTEYLKEGKNVIAVSLNQHTGGCYFDMGLSYVYPDPDAEEITTPFSLEGDNIGSSRMSRYFPLSYLVLTGSTPTSGVQWVGEPSNRYINWLSSMSEPSIIAPATHGAIKSNLMTMLRNNHQGVKLTDTELRTIAAWIDLCVPAYGSYDANNHWDAYEYREAQEEQNKRDYYNMLNSYSRMSLADKLPEGMLTAEFTDMSTSETFTLSAEGIVKLYVPAKYEAGDRVKVILPEGVKYLGFTLSAKMGEAIVYCPDGVFEYVVPDTSNMVTTISKSYANTTNYLTARLLTDSELKEKRNLAVNPYDYTDNQSVRSDITDQYPHISASSEWENAKGETHFYARNAVDGFTGNMGHGGYPLQSWGPANSGSQWLTLDFGRAVNADELGIVIRYDVGHDTWFRSAKVIVTLEDGTTKDQSITIAWTGKEQLFELDFDKPVTRLQLNSLVPDQSGGWAAFTEVAVYGTEK